MSTQNAYPHIEERPDGKLWLTGTQTKVVEVALDRLAHHWDADEVQRQHPHLTLGQIHSCLAYYYDHQEEMDRIIEQQLRAIEKLRGRPDDTNFVARLLEKNEAFRKLCQERLQESQSRRVSSLEAARDRLH
jgi:uncharacterized protein (DUF433 family)